MLHGPRFAGGLGVSEITQTMTAKAVAAMKAAVCTVVEEHRRRKRPLSTWENGKVVYREVDTRKVVHEDSAPYGTKS